ncbi:MAG TPA: class I SAM-dependent methyltransferase [Pyrinomonadaceae bacterium]
MSARPEYALDNNVQNWPDMADIERTLINARGIWNPAELVAISRCPLCFATGSKTIARRVDGLRIQECDACGLAYVDPRPTAKQLAEFYGKGYFLGERDFFKGKDYCCERDRAISDGSVTGYDEIVSNFNLKDLTILDVGCASGALLQSLRKHHPREVIGLDSAAYPVSVGVSKYGLDLRCETLESASFTDKYFDLITLIDVVEHLENLSTFLTELRRVLKPNGKVFVSTPNYASYSLARNEWACLYRDFEHLQYFSPRSIRGLCERGSFQIEKEWTDSQPIRTLEYPRVYRHHLHVVLHPCIALRNTRAKFRYAKASDQRHDLGLNLKFILTPN